jgi:hypothetical protein
MSESMGVPNGAASASATPAGTGQPYDKGNFEARVRNEPDFALAEVKKMQSYIAELQKKGGEYESRMKAISPLTSAAELVGNGNLEAGATQLVNLADRGYRIENDPKMKQWYESYVSGGKVPTTPDTSDEYLTPEQRELRELRQTVESLRASQGAVEGRTQVMQMQGHIESFFESDELGRAIDGSLRPELFKAMNSQFEAWARTPQGRQQLSSLDGESVRLIALSHLTKNGKLYEVAERARALKDGAVLAGADVPSISSMATEEMPDFSGPQRALRALQYSAKKYGVKL